MPELEVTVLATSKYPFDREDEDDTEEAPEADAEGEGSRLETRSSTTS